VELQCTYVEKGGLLLQCHKLLIFFSPNLSQFHYALNNTLKITFLKGVANISNINSRKNEGIQDALII